MPVEKGLRFSFDKAFYNPKAEVARGLGVLAARAVGPLSLFEAFAGGGTRTLLYAKHVRPNLHHVNEGNRVFLCELVRNYLDNGLPFDRLRITVSDFLVKWRRLTCEGERYDWVDLDPFGSPSYFLVGALSLVKYGGYVYITSTDTATLSGKREGDDVRLYGVALKPWETYGEMGARALIYSVWKTASTLNLTIEPIFVYYEGYAYRLLVRVKDRTSHEGVGFIQKCKECGTYSVSPSADSLCRVCYGENAIVGPVWIGPLYDRKFLKKMLLDARGLGWRGEEKALNRMLQEVDSPMYYPLDGFRLGNTPSVDRVVRTLKRSGFRASRTQFHPGAVKTNATRMEVLMAIQ